MKVVPLPLRDPGADVRRRAALVWLRGIQRDGRTMRDVAFASEILVCISLRGAPSERAASWIRRRATNGDAVARGWAAEVIRLLRIDQ